MPTETRKLQFDSQEIRAALVHYALRTEIRLPRASIDKVKIDDGGTVTFLYARDEDAKRREIAFAPQQVAAAIVLYCRTREFPLPRDAEKILKGEGGGISMMMRLVHSEDKHKTAAA